MVRKAGFQSVNGSSILPGATMNLLIVSCFVIPIAITAKSIVQDNQFMARAHQKQIDAKTWKQRNGVLIELSKMEDSHLANTIKMVARNCHKESYLGEMISDRSFIKLADECRRRKFQVSILNTPITVDGRREYIEVFIPHTLPLMKISASILPSDWDSRP